MSFRGYRKSETALAALQLAERLEVGAVQVAVFGQVRAVVAERLAAHAAPGLEPVGVRAKRGCGNADDARLARRLGGVVAPALAFAVLLALGVLL